MPLPLKNIVLIGVGGTGMSAIAGILTDLGYSNIVGIDQQQSHITDGLAAKGVSMIYGHGQYAVQPTDFVIYSDIAVIKETPELQQSFAYEQAMLKHHHRPYSYNEFLAELSKHFRTIAVTGTNGKSSTTALLIHGMAQCVDDFALGIVGALLPDYDNRNYWLPDDDTIKADCRAIIEHIVRGTLAPPALLKRYWFAIEACEHKEHFLLLDIDRCVITNIGYDHPDYYGSEEKYQAAFGTLMQQVKGQIFFPVAQENVSRIAQDNGFVDTAKLVAVQQQTFVFDQVFGEHWQTNASLVSAAMPYLEEKRVKELGKVENHIFHTFGGLWRRMELLGHIGKGCPLYSDYGHHPDAIGHALRACRAYWPDKRLVVFFEPHQAGRLLALWDDFVASLGLADQIYVYELYTAREDLTQVQASTDFQRVFANKDDSKKYPGSGTGMTETIINSFAAIGELFAARVRGSYVGDVQDVHHVWEILGIDDVAIIFSAGKLDEVGRGCADAI